MKKLRLAALMLALVLVLAACAGENPSVPYGEEDCRHVFGYWYDVETVTCLDAGKQIRYCKICREPQEQTVAVATDINQRNHAFSDTVVPPTEGAGGYTTRVCTLCDHRIENADPTPPLYALIADSDTDTTLPTGLSGVLFSDTVTHRLAKHAPTAVYPAFARRLATALVIADELSRQNTALMPLATLTVTADLLADVPTGAATSVNVFYVGATVTLEQTLGLWLATGGADAALVLAAFMDMTHAQLATAATARAEKLGLTDTAFTSLLAPTDFGTASLYDTGVLLCRALDEEILANALSSIASGSFIKIDGKTPAVWLASATLRISALRDGESVRFLLLAGDGIENGAESRFFTE